MDHASTYTACVRQGREADSATGKFSDLLLPDGLEWN